MSNYKIQLDFVSHLNCDDKGVLSYRCDEYRFTKQIITPKTNGVWGKGTAHYFIDGNETEVTIQELKEHIDRIRNNE